MFEQHGLWREVKDRPAFNRMMKAAHEGKMDVVVTWALGRLGRSMTGNLQTVRDLDRLGVQGVSVREPWLDTRGRVRALRSPSKSVSASSNGRRRASPVPDVKAVTSAARP